MTVIPLKTLIQMMSVSYKILLKELKKRGSHIVSIDWRNFQPTEQVYQQLKMNDLVGKNNFKDYPSIPHPGENKSFHRTNSPI